VSTCLLDTRRYGKSLSSIFLLCIKVSNATTASKRDWNDPRSLAKTVDNSHDGHGHCHVPNSFVGPHHAIIGSSWRGRKRLATVSSRPLLVSEYDGANDGGERTKQCHETLSSSNRRTESKGIRAQGTGPMPFGTQRGLSLLEHTASHRSTVAVVPSNLVGVSRRLGASLCKFYRSMS
jgi:hypothetical protein